MLIPLNSFRSFLKSNSPRVIFPIVPCEGSYKFHFYSLENNEPPHIHVWSTKGQMKVWLNDDLEIEECYGIPRHEWRKILEIIVKNKKTFLNKWYDFKKRG